MCIRHKLLLLNIQLYINLTVLGYILIIHIHVLYMYYTVEALLKDTPYKGHYRKILISWQYILDLQREDILFIKDKMPGPKVSFIWRFHYTMYILYNYYHSNYIYDTLHKNTAVCIFGHRLC